MTDYEWLREFCKTDKQRSMLDALKRSDTIREAALEHGVAERNIYAQIKRLKKIAADEGVAPGIIGTPLPEGQNLKGISTMYGPEGEIKAQWVKSQAEAKATQNEIEEAIQAFSETVPKATPAPKAKSAPEEILNTHILTDYHLGMNAWKEDAGENWDIKIAEDLLVRWFAMSIQLAPQANTAILAQLGDFLHWDGMEPVTPVHKHILDADTRFQKVIRVAIRSLRRIIHMMLKKYPTVHLVMADANHDPASSAWLREMFAAFYDDEPRITVDNSADTYYCYEHGLTSLFFHHGHKRKPSNIDDVFAAKFRDVFGRTKHSYAHMGHMHHKDVKETNLMIVEQHRTMAAKDAYANTGGWLAGRSAPVITYHKDYGEVGRVEVTPEMV